MAPVSSKICHPIRGTVGAVLSLRVRTYGFHTSPAACLLQELKGGGGGRLRPRGVVIGQLACCGMPRSCPLHAAFWGAGAPHAQTPSAEDGKDGVTWEEGAGAVGVCSSSTSRSREVKPSLMASLYASISLQISLCKVPQFW